MRSVFLTLQAVYIYFSYFCSKLNTDNIVILRLVFKDYGSYPYENVQQYFINIIIIILYYGWNWDKILCKIFVIF